MPKDTTRRVPAKEARRKARIDQGKDPDDPSDVYRGRPAPSKKLKPIDTTSTRYVPAPPLSLADPASQLGVRPVQLAQAIQEGKVATVRGRGGEVLVVAGRWIWGGRTCGIRRAPPMPPAFARRCVDAPVLSKAPAVLLLPTR